MKRILVLKGGGVRGVLQLDSLRIIEKHYKKQIYEIFDLIVGTSVGAI
ncbi:MAG: patatin-like phospholipase family protein, partial [Promethearchaeota archaeon]